MAWGAAIGAAGGILGGLSSGLLSGRINARASAKAARRQRKILQNQYRWAVHDLTEAGLNPILAAGGGIKGGGASVPVAGTGAPGMNLTSSAREGELVMSEKKRMQAEAAKSRSQSFEANERGNEAIERTRSETVRQKLMRQEISESIARSEQYNAQSSLQRMQEIGQSVNNFLLSTQVPGAIIEKGIDSGVEGEVWRRIKRLGGAAGNVFLGLGAAGGRVPKAAKGAKGQRQRSREKARQDRYKAMRDLQ